MILFVLPSHGHICPNPQDLLNIQCGLLIPAKIVLVCLLAKTSLLTITENNNLIVKAFATAWKYKELYEQGIGPDNICKKEHISPRQLYRHLDLVYMNPDKINEILSGTTSVKIDELFQIAKTFLI